MMKRANLVVVFILLLGGVSLLANYQVEAGTNIGNYSSVYLGTPARIEVFYDAAGNFQHVCFNCAEYGCTADPPGGPCDSGWKQGLAAPGYLCTDTTGSNCINMNTAFWGAPTGIFGENFPWHCCPFSR
jgi:hypothetical protein